MTDSEKNPTKPPSPPESGPVAVGEAPSADVPEPPAVDAIPASTPGNVARPSPGSAARPRRTGRVLATFALLLSLVAIGSSGYLVYEAWSTDPNARFEAAIGAYQADLAAFQRATAAEVAALGNEIARYRTDLEELNQSLTEARAAMAEATTDNLATAPPTPREWKLAEVEYLLTIASHRLGMQEDAEGAQGLLALADQRLAELDDFRFHDVRALLAEDQLALKTLEHADTQGVFLRLEAVKGLLDSLPLRLPAYASGEDPTSNDALEPEQDAGMFDALLDRIGGLVRFRRHQGEALRPLLAPEEAEYLEQHLRLALERAQLAVLRRDQDIFAVSLGAARDWLHRFLDPERAAVGEAIGELDELRRIDLRLDPPDISRSLDRLRELRHGGDGAPTT